MTAPRLLVVQNSPTDPVGRLGDWLTAAGAVLEVVEGQQLPADPAGFLDGYAGLIVLGGPMSANDDDTLPWLATEKQILRDAVAGEVPTLGVCLGGQMLASATGGRVMVNPEGPELGAQLVAKRSAAATDPLFGPLPITPDVIQWHFDTIDTLPPGAVHLASSPVSDHQAFRVGRLAWGVQFHIETSPDVVTDWAQRTAEALPDLDLDLILSRAIAVHDDLAEVWAPFAQAFVDIARDPAAVPAPPAVRESTARPVTDAAAIRAALAAEAAGARTVPGSPAPLPMPGLRGRPD